MKTAMRPRPAGRGLPWSGPVNGPLDTTDMSSPVTHMQMVEIRLSPSLSLGKESRYIVVVIAAYSWWLIPRRLYAEQLATAPSPHFGCFNGDLASAEKVSKSLGSVEIRWTHHVLMS